jgi:tetratricopeptide (TPR) repeat protein
MRTDRWKFIVAPHPELYDLERDPAETNNLISNFPTEADRLQKRMWEVAGVQGPQEKIVSSPADSQTRRELESLGYVGAGTSRKFKLGYAAPDPKDRIKVLNILFRVEKLLGEKDYARAARLIEQGWQLDPTNPQCHLYLGMAYERMGQYQRAIRVYQHALNVKLETDRIYARKGVDYLRLNDFRNAVDAMVHANEINPSDLDNLRNLDMAYLELGQRDNAENAYKATVGQNDRYSAAYDGLGLVAVGRGDAAKDRKPPCRMHRSV